MSKTTVYEVEVMFGDCDPAGIVFFPNFNKWMDGAALNFLRHCGVPSWREFERSHGIVGMPLLEIHTKFRHPATYGERLRIHTRIIEWRDKVFVFEHRVMRGDELLCEGTETRAFVIHPPGQPERIKATPIPAEIKALCL